MNIVYNEKWETGIKRIPDGYFDLAVCDIPYGIDLGNMAYLSRTDASVKQRNNTSLNVKKKRYSLKDWDKQVPSQEYFNELCRVAKEQIIFGVEYVNWTGLGSGRIKWNKGVADGMSFKKYETAYCSLIEGEIELPLLWSGMQQAKSLQEPMIPQGNKRKNEKRIHPCQKPRLLYRKLYNDYGFRGMKILDTHVGSGSSRIEADLFDSDFLGFEADREYWLLEENRYKSFRQQHRLKFTY